LNNPPRHNKNHIRSGKTYFPGILGCFIFLEKMPMRNPLIPIMTPKVPMTERLWSENPKKVMKTIIKRYGLTILSGREKKSIRGISFRYNFVKKESTIRWK
jgi:hypothetical protein